MRAASSRPAQRLRVYAFGARARPLLVQESKENLMATIVVAYESRYGQAQKIAEHIADHARREGHDARPLRAVLATQATLEEADGIVVVAPVYLGEHPHVLQRFLETYRVTLRARPLAFVSVSNSAAQSTPDAVATTMRLARRTPTNAGLEPLVIACSAGALAYPRYGFLIRQMMRLIARSEGLSTDTKRVHELTNWDALDRDLAPFFEAPAFAPPRGERLESGPSLAHEGA